MELKGSYTYAAPIDAVIAMLGDAEVSVDLYRSMGHRDVEVLDRHLSDGVLDMTTSRVVDVDLPGFAKKVLRPSNTTVQTDKWQRDDDGSWNGTFQVEVKGSPVQVSGAMHLAPGDGTCVHEVAITVNVKVPIIGGRIADWAAKNEVRSTLDAQFAFYERWLAEHGTD